MTRQFPKSFKPIRFALTGFITLQAAIVTTAIHEVIATTPQMGGVQQVNAQGSEDLTKLYKKTSPAVVSIRTAKGSGSGAIIAANGLIVTNAHVVEGFNQVQVTLGDGRQIVGEVVAVGGANCVDLALVQVSGQTNLPAIALAASNSAEIGMPIVAIGNPLDIASTMTTGNVSNLAHHVGRILTDVRLNPGNSGGPLLNLKGQLVGIVEGGYSGDSGDGINVAISVEQVRALIQAKKQGISPTLGRFLIPATASSSEVAKISLNGTKTSGILRNDDHLVCEDQSRADVYTFEGDADQPVMIDMSSTQIGSYLLLLAPTGEVIAKSSEERGGTATVLAKLPAAGTYTVIANALNAKQLGAYQLQATVPLLLEQGRLTRNSLRLDDGSFYSPYLFEGKADETIGISLYQFDFDPYLILLDAAGKVVEAGKADRQSLIRLKLPRDGSYTLIVSTVNPGDRGQFSFSVQSLTTPQANQVSQN